MAKLKEPPFNDQPNPSNRFWSQSWFEWLRDIWKRVNERAIVVGIGIANHFAMFSSASEITDSGKDVPSGDVVGTTDIQTLTNKSVPDPSSALEIANKEYVDNSIAQTEAEIQEAGTEEGSRLGSFRIGLFTEDDYAYFDKNGKLIFYGTNGIQIRVPVNDSDTAGKIAVFDTDGNLEYRTLAEAIDDLSSGLASRIYVGEQYNTEAELPEAGTESGHHLGNKEVTGDHTAAGHVVRVDDDTTYEITEPIPVGKVVMFTVATNPHTLFGYGTWTLLAVGNLTIT